MTTPTTGTALCLYCASDTNRVRTNDHIVTGPLIRDHTELLRHRDESHDLQVDRRTGKAAEDLDENERELAMVASSPAMQEIEVDGLTVEIPTGFRPCFVHNCPTSRQRVVLYADVEGASTS